MKETFLVKLGSQLKLLSPKELDELTPGQLLTLGIACVEEQRSCLMTKNERLYYGRNVAEELERSLSKIEEKVPELRNHIDQLVFGPKTIN